MKARQSKVMIQLDVVSHLDDFVQHCFVKERIVLKVKGLVVVLLANDELLEYWRDLVVRVQLVNDLGQEVCLFGFFRKERQELGYTRMGHLICDSLPLFEVLPFDLSFVAFFGVVELVLFDKIELIDEKVMLVFAEIEILKPADFGLKECFQCNLHVWIQEWITADLFGLDEVEDVKEDFSDFGDLLGFETEDLEHKFLGIKLFAL